MNAVYKREIKSYFSSPLGFAFVAALMFFQGFFFYDMFAAGYGGISYLFSNMLTICMFAIPILTMRLFSEERKARTDQALFTAPVSLWSVVLAKFSAALTVFSVSFVPTIIFQIILAGRVTESETNWLMFLSVLLGALLYGGALIAIGVFVSALTESQVVAAVLGIVVSLLVLYIDNFASMIPVEWLSNAVSAISFRGRFEAFSVGISDFSNLIFFLSVIGIFLFLTERSLERRRWA